MSGGVTIIVIGSDGSSSAFTFDKRELSIGRAESNDIVLRDRNVSRRHARLVVRNDDCLLVDIVSTNGTFLNGRRLTSPMVVGSTDRVDIGSCRLLIGEPSHELTQERPLEAFIPRDRTEAALLTAISTGDDDSRQVYGDWLEEHGHMREAEFVRVQQALVAMDPDAVGFESRSQRLRELAMQVDFRWRLRVARPAIERCGGAAFDFVCPRDWGALAPTDLEDVRHCNSCNKPVYYCTSVPEARGHAGRGECVALDLRAKRWPGDVEPPYGIQRCHTCSADVGRPPGNDCPRCGEPLRRYTMGMIA